MRTSKWQQSIEWGLALALVREKKLEAKIKRMANTIKRLKKRKEISK